MVTHQIILDNQFPDPYPSVKNPEPNQEHIPHHVPHVDGIDQLAHIPVEEYQEKHVPTPCRELKKFSTPEASSSRVIVYGSNVRSVARNLFQSPVVQDSRGKKDVCDESFSTESPSDFTAYQESDPRFIFLLLGYNISQHFFLLKTEV